MSRSSVSRQIDEWPVLSIPMRGNELSAAEVRASALTVIDPHEG